MFPIKVLQFPKTSLERVLGYILCPNQSSVMFLPTSMVIGRHKNNWWILKLVLNKWNESHIPSHILPHFRSLIWVWWKWINKLKSELNYLLSILTSCSRSFLYHFFFISFFIIIIILIFNMTTTVDSHLADTSLLRTPRHCGQEPVSQRDV